MVAHQLAESIKIELTRVPVHDFGGDWVLPELANGLCNLSGGKQLAVVNVQFEFEHSQREPYEMKMVESAA